MSGTGGTRREVVHGSSELISAEEFVGGELKRQVKKVRKVCLALDEKLGA